MDYRREYLFRLPLPLAQLYSRAYNDKSPQSRHNNTFYLFEALVKLAAAPAIACYVDELRTDRQSRVAELDRLLIQLALPSFGQWVGLLRELAKHFGSRPEAASHPLGHLWQQIQAGHRDRNALLALYRRIKNGIDGAPVAAQSCSVLDVFEALVQYRNGVFGDGGPRFESFYEQEMGPLLFPAANELLDEGVFEFLGPRGSRFVYLTEVRTLDEKRTEVGLRELVGREGERMAPLQLTRQQAEEIVPNRVAVLWPGRALPLRLDPLLVYRESETADEVLFLNRDRNARQIEYLSYTTGKTERDPNMAAKLCRLLSLFAGREIDENNLKKLSEQSAAEVPSAEALAAETPTKTVGRVWGDYEILAEIGRSGRGVVYLARQRSLGRLVALKMLPADLAADPVALARFRREIQHLARCEHPNIVKVLASGTMPDGELYYTMEYVPGCNLEQVWRELGGGKQAGWSSSKLGQSTWVKAVHSASRQRRDETASKAEDDLGGYVHRVCQLVRDAALALQAMHDQQLVHRDVKPANLMLTSDGSRIVLMDFGWMTGESAALTASWSAGFPGTLRYTAPEQFASAKINVRPQADVRGLGCVLWELLTGRRLFGECANEAVVATKVLLEDVPRLRTVDPGFDRDLEAIVARATERRIEDRIPSAGQLADYLQLYLDDKPLPIRPPTGRELLLRWCRQHALAATLLVAVALLLLMSALGGTTLAVIANRDAREAEEARHGAFESARLAGENAWKAEEAKAEAERAKTDADQNAQRAEREANGRNWFQYSRQIAKAQREWAAGNRAEARRHLDLCRWDFRDWEYDFLCAALKQTPTQSRPALQSFRGHKGGVYSVACSPDGTRLASSGADQTIKVWDASGREIHTLRGHTGVVWSVAFSPDGKRIASGSADQTIKLWDVSSGQAISTFKGHTNGVSTVTFSPDGRTIATGGADRLIKVWDIQSGQEIRTLKGHVDLVLCLAFSPDGARIASGSQDRTITIWDALSARKLRTLKGHASSVLSVAFSPDGRTITSGGLDQLIKVWDIFSDREIRTLEGHTGGVWAVRFSPDGKRIVSGSADQTIVLWQASSGQEVLTLSLNSEVRSLALSSDGVRLISGCWNGNISVFDASSSHGVPAVLEQAAAVSSVAFSADGKQIVSGSSAGIVKSWDASSGEEFFTLTGHTRGVLSVAVSPDSKRIASGSADKTIRVWKALSGKEEFELQGHSDAVRSVAFGPDGKRIASGSDDMTIKVWDVASGLETIALAGHTKGVNSVAFSPDGRRIASGSDDDTIKLWDAASGQETLTIKGHAKGVRSVTFSPDGKRIASGSGDKTIKVWDATSGREIFTLAGHAEGVNSVTFSPDGKRIASGSGDKTIKVWDATSGREIFTLAGHAEGVNSVAFSPDGKRIVSGSGDKTIKVWDASLGADRHRGQGTGQSQRTADDERRNLTTDAQALRHAGRHL